jgi:hypothetical protein
MNQAKQIPESKFAALSDIAVYGLADFSLCVKTSSVNS